MRVTSTSIILLMILLGAGCNNKPQPNVLFEALDHSKTGLHFKNNLVYDKAFNLFKYIYFYNGSGVGAGDFNNDGLVDLFFGSNQHQNTIYLNKGGLKFEDITTQALIPDDGGWTTGISVVDINNDGMLDIYVCRVGQYETLKGRNQLLVCQSISKGGIPAYKDEAAAYGLDFSGFSTQAAFLDYDMDGDLDMYLLNHSVHENGTYRPRKDFEGTISAISGDKMYQNNNGKFIDVSKQAGINSTVIGYGLGIAVADVNIDGYPDIYIGNDFHENDYLYINQKNGTFKNVSEELLMHTSKFSMGVDIADVTNDGYPEIISLDMLPEDPYILKRSLGEDTYDIFRYKIGIGYSYQYSRNNLQYNRRNGYFSEVGLYSGVAATDWSWAPLWVDFDNDGLKDLFVSNGIPKRLNDIDYINFISNAEVQSKINSNSMEGKDMSLIEKFPEIKLPNKFFSNKDSLKFQDNIGNIKNDVNTYSNGAIYADLDNDGDLDIVVNNIDDPVLLYENKCNDTLRKSVLKFKVEGYEKNKNATGSKIVLFSGNHVRTYEKFSAKGFLSSMEMPMYVGVNNTKVDSLFFIWPDNSYQKINYQTTDTSYVLKYKPGLPGFNYSIITGFYKNPTYTIQDITQTTGVHFIHKENSFVEFDREPLIPQMSSTEGPAVAIGDVNHDSLQDIYIGNARNGQRSLFLQNAKGKFTKKEVNAFIADSSYEDVSAIFADVNNDTYPDLIVASGGNEFYGTDKHNTPRLYMGDGTGNFIKKEKVFDSIYTTVSVVVANDFDEDGFVDLFIGSKVVPWEYGKIPQSYLLKNIAGQKFKDVTVSISPDLVHAGFVTNAVWADMNNDQKLDLLLSLQWGSITAFVNTNNKFTKKILTPEKGWWNFVYPIDVDGDGDLDIIAGNLGLNSRLKASTDQPVQMYYNDFDDNGKNEQIVTYFLKNKEIPFHNKSELEKKLPSMKKKFLYAEAFAKADMNNLFDVNKLNQADLLTANYFANAIFINKGNFIFELQSLPFEAQLTSYKTAAVIHANNDDLPDILLMGNYYDNNIAMGRYDADYGLILLNQGKGHFITTALNGIVVKGQVRHIQPLIINHELCYLLAKNNDTATVIRLAK